MGQLQVASKVNVGKWLADRYNVNDGTQRHFAKALVYSLL